MDENTPLPPSSPPTDSGPAPKSNDEKTLGLVCHLLSLTTFVVPFGNIIGPLILWLLKKAESPYLDAHGKEVLNFNISWAIYMIIAGLSVFVLIGFLLLPVVFLAWVIFVIIGSIKASEGKLYRYPLTIRFIN